MTTIYLREAPSVGDLRLYDPTTAPTGVVVDIDFITGQVYDANAAGAVLADYLAPTSGAGGLDIDAGGLRCFNTDGTHTYAAVLGTSLADRFALDSSSTIVVEFMVNELLLSFPRIFESNNTELTLDTAAGQNYRLRGTIDSAGVTAPSDSYIPTVGEVSKAAIAWGSHPAQFTLNGLTVVDNADGVLSSTLSYLYFGNRADNARSLRGWIRRITVYDAKKSASELQALTARTNEGTLSATDPADAGAALGVVAPAGSIVGTVTATDQAPDAAGSGVLVNALVLAATDGADAFAGVAFLLDVGGALAAVEAADSASIIGAAPYRTITARLHADDGADTFTTPPWRIGAIDATDGADALASAGTVPAKTWTGTIAATDGGDSADAVWPWFYSDSDFDLDYAALRFANTPQLNKYEGAEGSSWVIDDYGLRLNPTPKIDHSTDLGQLVTQGNAGTLMIDVLPDDASGAGDIVQVGFDGSEFRIRRENDGRIRFRIEINEVNEPQLTLPAGTSPNLQLIRIVVSWSNAGISLSANGGAAITAPFAYAPRTTFGGSSYVGASMGGWIRRLTGWTTRKSDAEIAAISATPIVSHYGVMSGTDGEDAALAKAPVVGNLEAVDGADTAATPPLDLEHSDALLTDDNGVFVVGPTGEYILVRETLTGSLAGTDGADIARTPYPIPDQIYVVDDDGTYIVDDETGEYLVDGQPDNAIRGTDGPDWFVGQGLRTINGALAGTDRADSIDLTTDLYTPGDLEGIDGADGASMVGRRVRFAAIAAMDGADGWQSTAKYISRRRVFLFD